MSTEDERTGTPAHHNRFTRDLTTGSIPRHLLAFSLPMLAGNVLHTAYSFVNAIWVGKFLGTVELAAVTVSFPVIFVLVALAGGLTMATNILIAQYAGAREWTHVKRIVQSSTLLIGLASLLLVVIGELFTPHLLRLMNTPPDVLGPAVGYMRIMLLTMPAAFGVFLLGAMLRGVGDSTTPLRFQAISVVITALLDPLLMFGLFGLPKMGLNGTAVATVIANVFTLVAIALYLHQKQHPVSPDWRRLCIDWPTWMQTFIIGLPSAAQQALVSVGMVVVVGIVNRFGEQSTAAFGAASRIDQLAFFPAMTIGMAVSTLAGQNIGANRYDRVHAIFKWGIILGGAITLFASLLVVMLPGPLLSLFTNDAEVIALGVRYLHVVGACYVIFAVFFVSNGIINGAGHTFYTTLISLVSVWVVRVLLANYLSTRLQRVDGIWYAMAASFAVALTLSLVYYYGGYWKKRIVRRAPEPGVDVSD